MTQFEQETKAEALNDSDMTGLYPKISQEFQILECILIRSARKLRHQLDVQDEYGSEEDNLGFDLEIEPQLLERAEAIMRANGLPLKKLPKMCMLAAEIYTDWVYEDIRASSDKQF